MQELIELLGLHARDGGRRIDQPLTDHLGRDAHRRRGGSLAVARLEQIQPPAFDGEFDVLHVAEVFLEPVLGSVQLFVRSRETSRHLFNAERRTNSGDDVLALRVEQELPKKGALSRRRIARKCHSRPRIVAHVSEDHRHYTYRGPEIVRDPIHFAIIDGLLECPRSPHGLDRAPQLASGIHREFLAGLAAHEGLVFLDEIAK